MLSRWVGITLLSASCLSVSCAAPIAPKDLPGLASTRPSAVAPPSAPPVVSSESPTAPDSDAPPEPPPKDERIVGKSGRVAFTKEGALWVTDDKGEHARKLVSAGPAVIANANTNGPAVESADIQALSFSPDESRIYFMKPGWATSMALLYAEVSTGKVFLFHDANGYTVIQTCKDKKQIGRVITFEHSYFDINMLSAVDYFFLVDSAEPKPGEERTGKSGRIGIVGATEKNVARFMAKTCGEGKAPPDDSPKLPAKLTGSVVKCNALVLKRADLTLLDGTKEIRFTPKDGEGEVFGIDEAKELCAQATQTQDLK